MLPVPTTSHTRIPNAVEASQYSSTAPDILVLLFTVLRVLNNFQPPALLCVAVICRSSLLIVLCSTSCCPCSPSVSEYGNTWRKDASVIAVLGLLASSSRRKSKAELRFVLGRTLVPTSRHAAAAGIHRNSNHKTSRHPWQALSAPTLMRIRTFVGFTDCVPLPQPQARTFRTLIDCCSGTVGRRGILCLFPGFLSTTSSAISDYVAKSPCAVEKINSRLLPRSSAPRLKFALETAVVLLITRFLSDAASRAGAAASTDFARYTGITTDWARTRIADDTARRPDISGAHFDMTYPRIPVIRSLKLVHPTGSTANITSNFSLATGLCLPPYRTIPLEWATVPCTLCDTNPSTATAPTAITHRGFDQALNFRPLSATVGVKCDDLGSQGFPSECHR